MGLRIKEIEQVTNHDVKAVELFLGERFEALLTRGKEVDDRTMRAIVGELGLNGEMASRLQLLDPATYPGPVLGGTRDDGRARDPVRL